MTRVLRRFLRLGVLVGIGAGIVKAVRGRRAPDPWAESWVSTGVPGATRPSPAPVTPTPSAAAAPAAPSSRPESPKPPATRTAKPTRTGPARRSPTGRAEEPPGERLWVQASDGVCPSTHPIKAKLSSKIFHTPSSRNYSRTKADRCYPDEGSAQADGLRPAQR